MQAECLVQFIRPPDQTAFLPELLMHPVFAFMREGWQAVYLPAKIWNQLSKEVIQLRIFL